MVDKKLVMEHEADGDFGYDWLKTDYAGSGPFTIREWRPTKRWSWSATRTGPARPTSSWPARSTATWPKAPPSGCAGSGDIDVARNLTPEEIDAVWPNPDIEIDSGAKGTICYLGLNQKNENLPSPKCVEAMK